MAGPRLRRAGRGHSAPGAAAAASRVRITQITRFQVSTLGADAYWDAKARGFGDDDPRQQSFEQFWQAVQEQFASEERQVADTLQAAIRAHGDVRHALSQAVDSLNELQANWQQLFEDNLRAVGEAAGQRLLDRLSSEGLLPEGTRYDPERAGSLLNDALMAGQAADAARAIIETTRDTLGDKLFTTIDSGGVDNAIAQLEQTYQGWIDGGRAGMIADTTVVGNWSLGEMDAAFQSANITGASVSKTWVSMGDDRVRTTHADADGQQVALGDTFRVGDEDLMFPGDPSASLSETAGCRCYVTYELDLSGGSTDLTGDALAELEDAGLAGDLMDASDVAAASDATDATDALLNEPIDQGNLPLSEMHALNDSLPIDQADLEATLGNLDEPIDAAAAEATSAPLDWEAQHVADLARAYGVEPPPDLFGRGASGDVSSWSQWYEEQLKPLLPENYVDPVFGAVGDSGAAEAAATTAEATATTDAQAALEAAQAKVDALRQAWEDAQATNKYAPVPDGTRDAIIDLARAQAAVDAANGGRGAIIMSYDPFDPFNGMDNLNAQVEQLFGRSLTRDELGGLVGAPEGAYVDMFAGSDGMEISLHGPSWDSAIGFGPNTSAEYDATRTLSLTTRGNMVMENNTFFINDPALRNQGLGAQVFADQVQSLSDLGVLRIQTFGAGDFASINDVNGYYTWPRFGYTGKLPDAVLQSLQDAVAAGDVPSSWGSYTTVQQLMRTVEGRDWWKTNGAGISLDFSLKPNSLSMRILRAYLAEKGIDW